MSRLGCHREAIRGRPLAARTGTGVGVAIILIKYDVLRRARVLYIVPQ